MSDIRFNQWLHQSGTGGVSQVDGGHVGIGTTNPDIAVHTANTKKINVGIVTANSVFAGNFYGDGSNLTGISAGVSVANQADDRLITATGTSNALNAESSLIYNSGGLVINSGDLYLNDSIIHGGNATTKIRFPSVNTISMETNGSERLRITSGGVMGLGTNSPAGMFEVQKNGVPAIIANYNNSKHLQMGAGGSGAGFHVTTGNFFTINHQPYADRGTDNNLTERFRIRSDGNVGINATNPNAKLLIIDSSATETTILKLRNYASSVNTKPSMAFEASTSAGQGGTSTIQGVAGTDAGGAANQNDSGIKFIVRHGGSGTEREAYTIKKDGNIHFPNGQGISFAATADGTGSSQAEILDDYEEGSWTPAVASGNASFSTRTGRYVKIGRQVTLWFRIAGGGSYSGSGGLQINGLPFTNSSAVQPIGNSEYYKIDFARDFSDHVTPYITGQNIMWLRNGSGGGSGNYLTVNLFYSSAAIQTCLTYETNS